MSDFINKAKSENDFNNGGSTLGTPGGGTAGPQTQLSNQNQEGVAGTLENNAGVAGVEGNPVEIDPLTGYPKCPGEQFRVSWPTSFEWDPLPPGSENYSRMSPCGCWLDLGTSLMDILQLIFAVAGLFGVGIAIRSIYGYFRKGANWIDDAIDGLIQAKKGSRNWPQKWVDEALRIKRKAVELGARVKELNDNIKKGTELRNAARIHATMELKNMNTALIDQEQRLRNKFADRSQYPFHLDVIQDYIDSDEYTIFDVPYQTEISDTLKVMYNDAYNDYQNYLKDYNYWDSEVTRWTRERKQTVDQIDGLRLERRQIAKKKQAELDEISQEAIDEVAANQTTFGGMMANLGYALAYAGVVLDLASGSLYKPKVCHGKNHKPVPNPKTCECECQEGYDLCKNEERVFANWLFNMVSIETVEQVAVCSLPCCGGQAKFEVTFDDGPTTCGCACLGDITTGTIISGGGATDSYWKQGNGCECLQRGLILPIATRGKCVSAFVEERSTALGQQWSGDECDFICPNTGTTEGQKCGGYARRKKITWTDSQGNTWPNQSSLCECECVQPDDWTEAWPPACGAGYIWDGSPTVCNCVSCPVKLYYCEDSGSADSCDSCPDGYECYPGDPENGDSPGCSKTIYVAASVDGFGEPTNYVHSSEACESQLGQPFAGWGAGYECSTSSCFDENGPADGCI